MPQSHPELTDLHAKALLRVADYLSRPQQFVAVGEARAAFRHTLEMAHQASVILTTNGEPAMALVPFTTLEEMRGALLHLFVGEMEASFKRLQDQVASEPQGGATSEAELEALVDDAVRRVRRQSSSTAPRHPERA